MKSEIQMALDAREERWNQKQALIGKHRMPVISVTLRMPRSVRMTEEACAFFESIQADFISHMNANRCFPLRVLSGKNADGPYCMYICDDASKAKRLSIAFEDTRFGSLIDADVTDAAFYELSRTDFGKESRTCIVCGKEDARVCIRLQSHLAEDTNSACLELIHQYIKGRK
ncbi:MAG: citrate lyase holo-[Clostridia bacterium]|nr:citrate lyase holo-[acyl-carrier protein] synthase [Clostridia bacterium]